MKTPITLAALLLVGSLGISGCSGDNNEVNVEVMQNNPENYMPELSPEQQAEIDKTKQMLGNRGWLNLKPKEDAKDDAGKDTPPSSD